jgi:hypothetical protein
MGQSAMNVAPQKFKSFKEFNQFPSANMNLQTTQKGEPIFNLSFFVFSTLGQL